MIKCICGKEYDVDESISWIYYPRFDELLCYKCVQLIHYRLVADYTAKIIGEFNFREWDLSNLMDYYWEMKEIISLLHQGILNNKSAVYILREVLNKRQPILKIDISKIPNLDKVQKGSVINRGITHDQAKSLTSNKHVADFFERLARCNFRIEKDYINYITEY